MEIQNSETISALLASMGETRGNHPLRTRSEAMSRRLRCTCGHCQTCDENERWERVFNEKFADPTYYLPRIFKRGSSLGR